MIMIQTQNRQREKNSHGGKRPGAGRKLKYGQETAVMRLPLNLVIELRQLSKKDLLAVTEQLHGYNARRLEKVLTKYSE